MLTKKLLSIYPYILLIFTSTLMIYLCFDIGNTKAHWCIYRGGIISMRTSMLLTEFKERDDIASIILEDIYRHNVSPQNIRSIISSVAPSVNDKVHLICKQVTDTAPLFLTGSSQDIIGIPYENKDKVGSDRVACCIAAQYLWPHKDVLIISFGTATVITVLNGDKQYRGGAIMPGIAMCARALHEFTALLPLVDIIDPGIELGAGTVASMQMGLFYGHKGGVQYLIDMIVEKFFKNSPPIIVITGGDGALFYDTKLHNALCEDLSIQGIGIFAEHILEKNI